MKSPYLLQSTESVALWVYLWFRCLSNEGRHMSNFTETVQPLDPVARCPYHVSDARDARLQLLHKNGTNPTKKIAGKTMYAVRLFETQRHAKTQTLFVFDDVSNSFNHMLRCRAKDRRAGCPAGHPGVIWCSRNQWYRWAHLHRPWNSWT